MGECVLVMYWDNVIGSFVFRSAPLWLVVDAGDWFIAATKRPLESVVVKSESLEFNFVDGDASRRCPKYDRSRVLHLLEANFEMSLGSLRDRSLEGFFFRLIDQNPALIAGDPILSLLNESVFR